MALILKQSLEFLQTDLPKILLSMHTGSDRIRQIILSLRNFSRLDESDAKKVDVHEGIENALLLLQHQLKGGSGKAPILLIKEYGNLPEVQCYPGQLNQVFMNILLNGVEALKELRDQQQNFTPSITIRTQAIAPDQVQIEIINNGPNIPQSIQQRIFDPFFTTKPIGQGTGMGLAISYQIIVETHKGILRCVSEPDRETRFIIQLPIH